MWRRVARWSSYVLLAVTLISGFTWLVLWGYGEEEMAAGPLIIAVIALVTGGVLAQLSRIESTRRGDDHRHSTTVHHPDGSVHTYPVSAVDVELQGLDPEINRATAGTRRPYYDRPGGPPYGPMGGTVTEEVRYYPPVTGTHMSVEEYDRWTDGQGPLEGQREEEEARKFRGKDPRYRY